MNLIRAVNNANVARVKVLLISLRSDITKLKQGKTKNIDKALGRILSYDQYTCKYNYEIICLLLEAGADYRNVENLGRACFYGDLKVVKLLLDYGANPNYVCLMYANNCWHPKIVQLLLDVGCEVDDWMIENAATPEIKEMLMRGKYRVDGNEYCKLKNLLTEK
jgi:ankyrin repeat protein